MNDVSVAVLGTICCDEIRRSGSEPIRGLGGIYYSLVTLAQLVGRRGSIFPVCKIGADDSGGICKQLRRYPAVKTPCIQLYPGPNNRVVLDYYSEEERTEYSTCLPDPFTIKELFPCPDVQIYLLNFISGREMGYRTVMALRQRLKIPLYVDLHSLFLGFGRNGKRYYRKSRDWSRWHVSGDIVQMNERESVLLSGSRLDSEAGFVKFGEYLVGKGASTTIITRGSRGALVVWKSGRRVFHTAVPAYSFGESSEPTGCGDVFSAAYAYRFLQGADPPDAADFASKVGGVRASQRGSAEMHDLRPVLLEKGIL